MGDDRRTDGPSTNCTFNEVPSESPPSATELQGPADNETPRADPCIAACPTAVPKSRKRSAEYHREYRARRASGDPEKRRKEMAEYKRKYRAQKKSATENNPSTTLDDANLWQRLEDRRKSEHERNALLIDIGKPDLYVDDEQPLPSSSVDPLSATELRGLGDDETPRADPCIVAVCPTMVVQSRRKTSAEYQRDYRARLASRRVEKLRKEMAEYKRDYRARKKSATENNQSTNLDETNLWQRLEDRRKSKHERNALSIDVGVTDERSSPSSSVTQSATEHRGLGDDETPRADRSTAAACSTSVVKRRRKTSAEYQREYRARLASRGLDKRRKDMAAYQRDYRARKKLATENNQSTIPDDDNLWQLFEAYQKSEHERSALSSNLSEPDLSVTDEQRLSSSSVAPLSACSTSVVRRTKRRTAESQREYRARLAADDPEKRRKEMAVYQREYRARKKSAIANNQSTIQDNATSAVLSNNGEPDLSVAYNQTLPSASVTPSSATELGELSDDERQSADPCTTAARSVVRRTKRRTAESQREYRARLAADDPEKRRQDVAAYKRDYRARKKSTKNNQSTIVDNANRRRRFIDPRNSEREESAFSSDIDEEDLPVANEQRLPSSSVNPTGEGDNKRESVIEVVAEKMKEEANLPYTLFDRHKQAHDYVKRKFVDNTFGVPCSICDRLSFQYDLLRLFPRVDKDLLETLLPGIAKENIKLCSECAASLRARRIPTFAVYNGFKYPPMPYNLPPLDVITERLISPRIPFMEIKRLRHINGESGIFGQIINVPLNVNTLVNRLPRDLGEDYSINVHIKGRKIHKSSDIEGLVNKRTVREWLTFLSKTPLYKDITIDQEFLAAPVTDGDMPNDDISEEISIDDGLVGQQQTLLLNEEKYLRFTAGVYKVPMSLLLHDNAEELSFPGIYLGEKRTFRDGIAVTHHQMALSEIRRTDRRGVTPRHLLYAAAKDMRLRVSSALTVTFKFFGVGPRVSEEYLQSEEYINQRLDTDLVFLRNIPNSAYYWAQRKRDLFAMMRQLGRPTIFLTISANEIGWTPLLQLLQRMKDGNVLSKEEATNLNWLKKCTLVNEDAVTCVIYFDKLVNTIMSLLQTNKICPFGQYRVTNFFKRIEFQHRASPHVQILLWLENSPEHPLGENKEDAIALIDSLVSVSASEASGNIELQTHKHTFTSDKRIRANEPQKCRFEGPFLPSRSTQILVPMEKEEPGYLIFAERYEQIKSRYEGVDYDNIDDFYAKNNILSDEDYHMILRAGIKRPRVFLKREPTEKWHNPFNPFLFHHFQSSMDIQLILDEYTCAAYVHDYVNKANRGVSNLQHKILEITEKHPDFGVVEIIKKMCFDLLNSAEMSSQEAAWWLLRKPMYEGSPMIVFIPTLLPTDRKRFEKAQRELALRNHDSTDVWKGKIIDKYEQRPPALNELTLAQFGAMHMRYSNREYKSLTEPRIIRYVNYDRTTQLNDYKREMVLLHIPFRNEGTEILAESKYLQIYTENEHLILERRKEFESNFNIDETLRLCQEFIREEEIPEPSPQLHVEPDSGINEDLRLAKKKMPQDEFCELTPLTNIRQRSLLLEIVQHLASQQLEPLRIFLTGPSGRGKTFVIRLILELYNKYASSTNAHCNAYLTSASTGKAAIAKNGTVIHSALSLSPGVDNDLSEDTLHQLRSLFQHIRLVIIDEVRMAGADSLERIDKRLQVITGKLDVPFGGLDVILIGNLRQVSPVKATPILKQSKHYIDSQFWRSFNLFELAEVMRQSNIIFSTIVMKIGNGDELSEEELTLLESRFVTEDEAADLCPHGIRLLYSNKTIDEHNRSLLTRQDNEIISNAVDFIMGCQDDEQRESALRALDQKKLTADTGGLSKSLKFVIGQHYIITTDIDVVDGLTNGAIGTLAHVEQNANGEVTRVWLVFPTSDRKIGSNASNTSRAFIIENNINPNAVPISRRNATIYLNRQKTLWARRNHFPLAPACGLTIHKSQGTFDQVVYYYEVGQSEQLVSVAMSRATSIDGLWIISVDKKRRFYHGRRTNEVSCLAQRLEMEQLRIDPYVTLERQLFDFLNSGQGLQVVSDNCERLNESLSAHANDLMDRIENVRFSKEFLINICKKMDKIAYMREYRARNRNRDSFLAIEQVQVNDDVKKNKRLAEEKAETSIYSEKRMLIKRFLAANRSKNWRARQRIKKSNTFEKLAIEDSSRSSVTTAINETFTEHGSVRVKYEENLLDFNVRAKCSICNKCENDFIPVSSINTAILTAKLSHVDLTTAQICTYCYENNFTEEFGTTSNGLKCDPWPDNFPELDPLAEGSLSPNVPSMEIQRFGQEENSSPPDLMNLLVCMNTVDKPNTLEHDYCTDAYEKSHEPQLIYVPVSRVTNFEGVFMMDPNSSVFDDEPSPLSLERFDVNPLEDIQNLEPDIPRRKQSPSFRDYNCQNLRELNDDSSQAMDQENEILKRSETEFKNEEGVNLFNFECCVRFKGEGESTSGVGVYQKENTIYIKTPNMDVQYRQTSELTLMIRAIGDVCVTEFLLPNRQKVLSVVVYISPNQKIDETKTMLHSVLLPYTGKGSAEYGEDCEKMAMILGGNFSHFALPEAEPLISFFNDKLKLRMINIRKIPSDDATSKVDTVFTRYLETLELNVSYISHQQPVISCIRIRGTECFRNA